jgi:hypothetical protein
MHRRSDADGEKRCECNATYVLYSKSGELEERDDLPTIYKKLSIHHSVQLFLLKDTKFTKADVIVGLGVVL